LGDIALKTKRLGIMINQFKTFDELSDTAAAYLKSLAYSSSSVDSYTREWRYLNHYMHVRGIQHYNASVGVQYLADTVGDVDCKVLPRSQRNRIRAITVLSDFAETGTIRKRKKRQEPRQLDGPIGKVMTEYITQAKHASGLAASTIQSYYLYLSAFLGYLNKRGVTSFEHFDQASLLDFANDLGEYSIITRHLIVLKTNQFLKYLFDSQILPVDYSRIMPKTKYVRQPNLPSYYSPEEVEQLINCIDRSNPNGKRDYAMVLLVARIGLRCSDIANLKFSNIIWERKLVSINQRKTKEPIELPLFPEIGNAIIDYLKHGRPQSSLSYVFLRHIPPYDNVCNNLLYGIIQKYMNLAGIKYDERRHGPHSLRHSLATNLLKKEITLPVISSVLGHARSESTMFYLRVDTNSLRRCALEVPAITQSMGKEVAL
jgi:site-specific recombinase XerD